MLVEDSQYVAFDDTDEDLAEALRRLGILEYIERVEDPQEREEARREAIRSLKGVFDEIRDAPANQPEGEVSAFIKNKHFSIWKTVFVFIEVAVKVTGAVKAPVTAFSLIPVIPKLGGLVKGLDENEMLVVEALTTVTYRKQPLVLKEEGASAGEVEKLFDERGEEPPNVEAILRILAEEKQVLKSRMGADGKTRYYELVT